MVSKLQYFQKSEKITMQHEYTQRLHAYTSCCKITLILRRKEIFKLQLEYTILKTIYLVNY